MGKPQAGLNFILPVYLGIRNLKTESVHLNSKSTPRFDLFIQISHDSLTLIKAKIKTAVSLQEINMLQKKRRRPLYSAVFFFVFFSPMDNRFRDNVWSLSTILMSPNEIYRIIASLPSCYTNYVKIVVHFSSQLDISSHTWSSDCIFKNHVWKC